jgi:hypothetical protein
VATTATSTDDEVLDHVSFLSLIFIGCAFSAPDGSSPRRCG